jgi:site-specific DNA recombinase
MAAFSSRRSQRWQNVNMRLGTKICPQCGLYLELGSVRLLGNDLRERGIVSGARVSRNGNAGGVKPFSRGALYHLLSDPIYLGEIRHKHERHPGQHEAIVSRELWERVQQRLQDQGVPVD